MLFLKSSAAQHDNHPAEKNLGRLALMAALALSVASLQAAPQQAAVRKSEVVKTVQSNAVAKIEAIADLTALASHSVLIQDASSGETLFAKNAAAVTPIASITKLMTAMVVLDRGLDLNARVVISEQDMDSLKFTSSRLKPGAMLTRDELLLLALMSSENRAAAALGRTYPGGTPAFVAAMNAKARSLGMVDSRFNDANGLSPLNVSSAPDLARLVKAAYEYAVIRQDSTRDRAQVSVLGQLLKYRNTNALVHAGNWNIGLQKTGFINEAGRCLVMRATVASKDLVFVLLDSVGKNSRIADAKLVRQWLESTNAATKAAATRKS